MATTVNFDTANIVFSNDDQVSDIAPISPAADINELRENAQKMNRWFRVREQMADGGKLAKMVTFRDLLKYGLLNGSPAGIYTPIITTGTGGTRAVSIQLACSDLTSDIEPNPYAAYFRMPASFTLQSVRASLLTPSGTGVVEVGMKVNGTNMLTTNLFIDAAEKTSLTATTASGIAVSSIASDAEIIIEIIQSGLQARGLEVSLIGRAVG